MWFWTCFAVQTEFQLKQSQSLRAKWQHHLAQKHGCLSTFSDLNVYNYISKNQHCGFLGRHKNSRNVLQVSFLALRSYRVLLYNWEQTRHYKIERRKTLPESRKQTTEEKEAIALDKWRKEGKESVDRHANQERLLPAHFVCQSSPEERPHHHPEVHYAACNTENKRTGQRLGTSCTCNIKQGTKHTPAFCTGKTPLKVRR